MTKTWRHIGVLTHNILKAYPEGEIVIRRGPENIIYVTFRKSNRPIHQCTILNSDKGGDDFWKSTSDLLIDHIFDHLMGDNNETVTSADPVN
jgi:hypothetical protein